MWSVFLCCSRLFKKVAHKALVLITIDLKAEREFTLLT